VLRKHVREVGPHSVAEDDRIGHLHHRRLEVQREQHALFLGVSNLCVKERAKSFDTHHRGVDHFVGKHRNGFLEHCHRTVSAGDVLDADGASLRHRDRLLVVCEVAVGHGGDVALRFVRPGAHRMRVGLGVILDGLRRTPVGVALTEHRVHGRTHRAAVCSLDRLLFVGRGVVRVLGEIETMCLELDDRCLELRYRCRYVRELDDVRFRCQRHLAELGERISHTLPLAEAVREGRQDSGSERNVTSLDADVGGASESLDDRKERVRGKCRRFVGEGVDDLRVTHEGSPDLYAGVDEQTELVCNLS
jgi:hypothetical protein